MSGWRSVANRISVVVISRNEGRELKRTVENLDDTLPAGGEIIVIDDGSKDGSADHLARRRGRIRLHRAQGYGVARARNFGARQARGNVIVYADAHLRLPADWWRPILEVLQNPKVGAVAPAIVGYRGGRIGYGLTFKDAKLEVRWLRRKPRGPVEAPIIPGCCFATRRDVMEATGGWDDRLLQRGNIDNECSVRFWTLGYDLMITPDTVVAHKFRKRSPYYVGWPEFLFNRLRLAFVHFNPERLGKVVGALRAYPGFGEALALLAASDIAERRKAIDTRRVRGDDCYFTRFGICW
jgi:glycosyltransferase involved in cell wall biosynthesis